MPDNSIDLWPSDIDVDVLSPTMILREQAEALTKRTKGIVRGEVQSGTSGELGQLTLHLVAPLSGFRRKLLVVRYAIDLPYPVLIMASSLVSKSSENKWAEDSNDDDFNSRWNLTSKDEALAREANSPEQVRAFLKIVFNAPATRATLFSLIARSNEVSGTKQDDNEKPANNEK